MKKPITDPEGCTTNIRAMNDALELLSGKWKLLILHYLMTREQEENTFKKIEKDLNGISAKVLSQETKNLSYKRKRLINGNLFKISTVLNGFEQEFYVDVQNVKMVILSRDIGKDTLNCDTIKYRIKYLE